MKRLPAIAVFLLMSFLNPARGTENWVEYRGPTGQGIYAGKNVPSEWSKTKNVVWKEAIPGKGWSSPIVWEGRVYLTSAVPIKESKDWSLEVLCLSAKTGKLLWQKEIFREDGVKAPRPHSKNGRASPSPLTDGKYLYVHFGHQGTACLDLDGKVIWRNKELSYTPVHGNGGSPILVDDRLVFSVDGSDQQYLVALDKANGKVVWKVDRESKAVRKFSFATPLLIDAMGQRQIISQASDMVMAYAPADGKEIWRVKYDGFSVIPRPVYGHGMVYFSTGYGRTMVMAIRVDGKGDVTKTHVAWTMTKAAPNTPSLLLVGDELYMVSDSGIASCLNALTGKAYWQERVGESGDGYSASPLYADGKIYLQSEKGITTVLRAGKKFEVLATNKLDERTFASYAVADGSIYLRTEGHLYRIQAK